MREGGSESVVGERLKHWVGVKLWGSPSERGIRAGEQFIEGYKRGLAGSTPLSERKSEQEPEPAWKAELRESLLRAYERIEDCERKVIDADRARCEAYEDLARARADWVAADDEYRRKVASYD